MGQRKSFFHRLTGWLLLLALVVGVLGGAGLSARAAPEKQVATNIVISEFRFRGPNGGNDEFIELYNPTNAQIDISDWRIWGSNDSGGTGSSPRYIFPASTILQSGQYYLITNNASLGYSGSVAGDDTYSTGITDNGGIGITLSDNVTLVDAVGLSNGSAYQEGTPLSSLGTSNQDRGYERMIGGNAGSCVDSNDNSSDFQLKAPSSPQNSLSPTTTCGYLPQTIVISEVAWAGTQASEYDEWIELHNPGSSTISLDGWILTNASGSFYISFDASDSIAGGGYFLIERGSGNATSAMEQKTYSSGVLSPGMA